MKRILLILFLCAPLLSKAQLNYRDSTKYQLDTVGTCISVSSCSVYQFNAINTTTSPAYIKFYNVAHPGISSIPVATILVPPTGTCAAFNANVTIYSFLKTFWIRTTTGVDKTDNGEPTKTTTNQIMLNIKIH